MSSRHSQLYYRAVKLTWRELAGTWSQWAYSTQSWEVHLASLSSGRLPPLSWKFHSSRISSRPLILDARPSWLSPSMIFNLLSKQNFSHASIFNTTFGVVPLPQSLLPRSSQALLFLQTFSNHLDLQGSSTLKYSSLLFPAFSTGPALSMHCPPWSQCSHACICSSAPMHHMPICPRA